MAGGAAEGAAEVRIGAVAVGRTDDGWHQARAEVDGTVVRFSSPDVALARSPEAFGSAFLVAAHLCGRPLQLADAVDRRWLAGTRAVADQVERWWSAPARPVAARTRRRGPARWPGARGHRPATSLSFTAGVDSFHTLLSRRGRVDVLVLALGYDISTADAERCAQAEATHRTVAEAVGARPVVIATDLLDHPLHRATSWEQTHGGPLAALAHLLAPPPRRHLVSASFPISSDRPWGTHWTLDEHWSTHATAVEHVGHDVAREDKVAAIAGDALAVEHLTVCWEHRSAERNCGRCDKCLETMVMLRRVGASVATLPDLTDEELADRLAALDRTAYRNAHRRLLARGDLPPTVARALADLLERTAAAAP